MIKNIKLKFGRAPGLEHTKIDCTAVTVFVGPNNSGKSQILKEIYRYCAQGTKNTNDLIIEEIIFNELDLQKAENAISSVKLKPTKHDTLQPDHILVGKRGTRLQVHKQNLLAALQKPNERSNQFCQWYLVYNTIILDGKNRINLINEQNAGDLQSLPQTSFQVLFKEDQKREEVRRIIYDAFGLYFVIDPTHLGKLRIRLASHPPKNRMEEQGIHRDAVNYHSKALLIQEASDGVKAFTGMIIEIIAGDPKILLIDEPEAFLHPSLSYKLGKEISQASVGTNKRIFVSTHSSNFVMGCIQSGAPINIVRLTYRDGIPTARVLSNNDILKLMRNPLLRSTGVLEGLFYEYVVVTESDSDRAFYQEINNRMLGYKPEWGIPNCLFINAQNKQTIPTITKPLREMGVPAAGIVDVDILKEGGVVWKKFLEGGFVPAIAHEPLSSMRAAIKKRLEESGLNMKRDGGVDILSHDDKEAANNLFDQLQEYGLFVVRGGELESWLKELNANGLGPAWLIEVFEKLGEDPEHPDYVKPSNSDVWYFINELRIWFFNQQRKGIPS